MIQRANHVRVARLTATLIGSLLVLTACGGGGGGGSDVDPTPSPNLSVTLSKTSAMPFTSIEIAATGLSSGASVDVGFSNESGYSVTARALNVSDDGRILTGVPLYVDPVTHAATTGQVSVIVRQVLPDGSQGPQSSPVSLAIQDLPALSGMPTGKISYAFFAASALIVQKRLAQLQFLETASGGKIDTAAERQSNMDLLKSIIAVRNNIDDIMNDPGVVVEVGTAEDGSHLQFSDESLSILDRSLLVWLSGLPIETPAARAIRAPRMAGLDAASGNTLLQQLSTWVGLASDVQTLQANESSWIDNSLAFLDGVSSSASLFGANTDSVGLFLGWAGVLNATYRYLGDWEKVVNDVAACVGAGPCNTAVEDTDALLKNGAGQLLSSYAQAGINNLNFLNRGALTGPASLAVAMYNYVSGGTADHTNLTIGANIGDALGGGGWITGTVQDGSTRSGLDMILVDTSLCSGSPIPMSSISDVNGNYYLSIPRTPYCERDASLTIRALDPLTATSYGSEVVYLGDIDSTQPVSVPAIDYTGPSIGTTPAPTPAPAPAPTPTPVPTPTNACCGCAFDVYCTAFGPGGCWRCQEYTMVGDVCPAPYGSLTSEGACVCDADLYEVCQ